MIYSLEIEYFANASILQKYVNESKLTVKAIVPDGKGGLILFYTEEDYAKEVEQKSKAFDPTVPLSPKRAQEAFKTNLDPRMIQAVNNLLAQEAKSKYITLLQKDVAEEYFNVCASSGRPPMDTKVNHIFDFEDIFRDAGWKVSYDRAGYNENWHEPQYNFSPKD